MVTGTQLLNFTVNNSIVSNTTTSGVAILNLLNGTQTISFFNDLGYYNVTVVVDVGVLSNATINLSNIYNHKLSVFAINNLSGAAITNFRINLSSGSFTTSLSDSGNNVTLNISNLVNYNGSFIKDSFAIITNNISSLSGGLSNFTFQVFSTNSLEIRFFDIDNQTTLFNKTAITVQFIGTTSKTVITTNGTLFVDLLSPDEYTILYDAVGYEQGKYIVTVTNRSYQLLTLYLQNETEASLVLITVTDKFGNELEGVEVTVQRWSNNSWRTEQISKTDFQGRTEAYYVLSTVFYNHVLTFEGVIRFGVINGDDQKKVIYAEDVTNGINFQIDLLGGSELIAYESVYDVTTTLSYTNTSNSTGFFSFFWSDVNNLDVFACLKVRFSGNATQVCENCSTSATGTVICIINQSSGVATYVAVGEISGFPVKSLIKVIGDFADDRIDWGVTGYIFAIMLLLVAFFAFSESPTISLIVGTVAFALLGVFGIIFDGVTPSAFIAVIAVAVLIARIKSEGGVNG